MGVWIEKREKKQVKNITMKKREFYRESERAGDSAQKRESPAKSGRLGTYATVFEDGYEIGNS